MRLLLEGAAVRRTVWGDGVRVTLDRRGIPVVLIDPSDEPSRHAHFTVQDTTSTDWEVVP